MPDRLRGFICSDGAVASGYSLPSSPVSCSPPLSFLGLRLLVAIFSCFLLPPSLFSWSLVPRCHLLLFLAPRLSFFVSCYSLLPSSPVSCSPSLFLGLWLLVAIFSCFLLPISLSWSVVSFLSRQAVLACPHSMTVGSVGTRASRMCKSFGVALVQLYASACGWCVVCSGWFVPRLCGEVSPGIPLQFATNACFCPWFPGRVPVMHA